MLDILGYLPTRRKSTASGWISFNAPCCVHNGESADRRRRGGIKVADANWSFHCFNCGYTASFVVGRTLSYKARKLLQWLNVPEEEIKRINLESLRHRNIEGILQDRQNAAVQATVDFEDRDLPYVDIITPEHKQHWQYLRERGAPEDYPFMLPQTYDDQGQVKIIRDGVVIPFTWDNRIVGHTVRFFDDRTPRYIHDMQPGYVFGTDLQQESWQHVLVMEGVFDALSLNGVAVLHAEINDTQARIIRGLDRAVTVVPDQDAAGLRLVDRALELGWAVSMPAWPNCKDTNDAVRKLGKLGTLLTIMQARETSRIKIELRKKQIAKKIQ